MKTPIKITIIPLSEVPLDDEAVKPDGPTVLVVDDERLVADTLSMIFQRAGFTANIAYSAKEALGLARLNPPDVLVSDVDMPGINGVDLALSLLEFCPDCEVLLFSGHATNADLAKATAAGYDFPLLPKPVHPRVILDSVSRKLGVALPHLPRIPSPLPRINVFPLADVAASA